MQLTSEESMADDLVAALAVEHLRKIQEAAQALYGAPGPRALSRRFAELLSRDFGVKSISCVRIVGRGPKLTLKSRDLGLTGGAPLDDGTLAALGSMFAEAEDLQATLRDGVAALTVGGKSLSVALIDDPKTSGGVLLAWELPQAAAAPLLRTALDSLVRTLQQEARWMRRMDKTQAMLYQDDLTGLYNYRYLEIALESELRRADRFQSPFCLLFIDLDGFKPINDEHGHPSGSSVLRQVAEVIREAVREVDIPIRYGGDEFVVVLLGATCATALLAAERVRRRIEAREFQLDGGATTRLTASIGVAAYPEHGRDRVTLLKVADETMYSSKKAGKNRVMVVPRRTELD